MSRKRLFIRIAVIIAAALGIWLYEKHGVPPPAVSPESAKPAAPSATPAVAPARQPPGPSRIALMPPAPGDLANIPPNPMAAAIGSPGIPPEKEIQLVLDLFQYYRREFGSFPSGETNAHFMNALRGSNPAKLPIFPMAHPRLDPAGNLLDPWGQAYVIHPVSRDRLEIRSKGPDKEPFTADDLLIPR